jgi:PhnB protein
MPSISPYLTFNGNCEEAFNFYKSVFGGEFSTKMTFKDAPPGQPLGPGDEKRLMHVSLPVGKGPELMGSDSTSAYGDVAIGGNFSISVNADDEKDADRIFNGLSAGGKVVMPMQKVFWGSYFGMLTDKFGIQWMVSVG